MNGLQILQQMTEHPDQLQYWEIIIQLMQQKVANRGESVLVQNIRNTHGTGYESIEPTIERLKNDGFYVNIVQNVTKTVNTKFGTIEALEYTTIKVSEKPIPQTKFMGSITDPEINLPLPNKHNTLLS